jgi:hypothetical protein
MVADKELQLIPRFVTHFIHDNRPPVSPYAQKNTFLNRGDVKVDCHKPDEPNSSFSHI